MYEKSMDTQMIENEKDATNGRCFLQTRATGWLASLSFLPEREFYYEREQSTVEFSRTGVGVLFGHGPLVHDSAQRPCRDALSPNIIIRRTRLEGLLSIPWISLGEDRWNHLL